MSETIATVAVVLWVLVGIYCATEAIEEFADKRPAVLTTSSAMLRILQLAAIMVFTIACWPLRYRPRHRRQG